MRLIDLLVDSMKHFIPFFVCFLIAFSSFGSVEMTRVDPTLFIADPKTDFNSIEIINKELKQKMVEYLFDNDLLNHEKTKAFDSNAKFSEYYSFFGPQYRLFDMNHDGLPELVFCGVPASSEEKEFLEIYTTKQGNVVRVYSEPGFLMAYKVHPNTKEIVFYSHAYPCCSNASHNLDRLRLIGDQLSIYKRYFLGRDHDMVGPFFPKKSNFTGKYYRILEKKVLFWSPAQVDQNAWKTRSFTNRIAEYDSTAVYSILAEESGFYFVLMHGAPVSDKSNRVINTSNFSSISIYGWIKKEED